MLTWPSKVHDLRAHLTGHRINRYNDILLSDGLLAAIRQTADTVVRLGGVEEMSRDDRELCRGSRARSQLVEQPNPGADRVFWALVHTSAQCSRPERFNMSKAPLSMINTARAARTGTVTKTATYANLPGGAGRAGLSGARILVMHCLFRRNQVQGAPPNASCKRLRRN
jgi:hypothetical protein